MGCACSVDNGGHGPAHEDLSNLPAPTLDELRMHREIDNVDFYSDAVSADEPSGLAASVAMKARLLVFRLSHGIDDNPNQFQDEINANEPVVVMEDYEFVGEWMAENAVALDGEAPEPVPDALAGPSDVHGGDDPLKRARDRNSVKTQPATMQTAAPAVPTACGAKPNHIRRRSSTAAVAAADCVDGAVPASLPQTGAHAQAEQTQPPKTSPQAPPAPAPAAVAHNTQNETSRPPPPRDAGDAALPVPFRHPPPPPQQRPATPGEAAAAGSSLISGGLSTSSLEGNPHDPNPANKYKQPLSPATETTEVEPSAEMLHIDSARRKSASPGAAVKPLGTTNTDDSVPGAVRDFSSR